eukprot:15074797-Ditylum_brightwellii.AAC.1
MILEVRDLQQKGAESELWRDKRLAERKNSALCSMHLVYICMMVWGSVIVDKSLSVSATKSL